MVLHYTISHCACKKKINRGIPLAKLPNSSLVVI